MHQVNELTLRDYLEKHYQHTQQFWQRQSVFAYQNEQMHLTEIILPSMEQFL